MKGICNRLFEFRDGHVKEYLCDIEEFMQIRKVERLNELDLDKNRTTLTLSGVEVSTTKETKVTVDAKTTDQRLTTNDQEKKQLQNKLKKIEETIEKLELELKTCDSKLANPTEYEKLVNDTTFFDNYTKLKLSLDTEMKNWEEVSGKL